MPSPATPTAPEPTTEPPLYGQAGLCQSQVTGVTRQVRTTLVRDGRAVLLPSCLRYQFFAEHNRLRRDLQTGADTTRSLRRCALILQLLAPEGYPEVQAYHAHPPDPSGDVLTRDQLEQATLRLTDNIWQQSRFSYRIRTELVDQALALSQAIQDHLSA